LKGVDYPGKTTKKKKADKLTDKYYSDMKKLNQEFKQGKITATQWQYKSRKLDTDFTKEMKVLNIKPTFKENYYIVRRWDEGDKKQYAHFYPPKNGLPPKGFKTKKAAQDYINEWRPAGAKVVSQKQAPNYEVPERY